MFRGFYEHNIDYKGRVSFPAHFRELLLDQYSEKLIMTHFQDCLVCYPQDEWEILENKIAGLSQFKKEVQVFQRYFLSGATEVSLDKQGRVLIPGHLRDHAALEKELVFVGMLKKIEIWSKARWKTAFEDSKDKIDDITGVLSELGI